MRSFDIPMLMALTGALALQAGLLQAQSSEPPPFIQVNGTGQVYVPSDRARLNFAVVTEGETAAQATADNATLMAAVILALRATGATGLSVESWGYDLQPRYSRPTNVDQTPRIVGYQAANNVRATVEDVTAVGRLIDAAVSAGANRITSLQFDARDTEAAQAEALDRAVRNARAQAEAMAGALGVPLGQALEVQGGVQQPGPRPMPYMAMEMARADTPIEAAEQVVSAHVTVKYRLGEP